MRAERGFTLLEVLAAFVILALAGAALYEGGAGGVAASAAASRYQYALVLARSHLDDVGRGAAIAEQDQSFTDGDGFTCRLHVKPIAHRDLALADNDVANNVQQASGILFEIEVVESWKTAFGERHVRLATRRFEIRTVGGNG
jgi:general secretion pathway protein I